MEPVSELKCASSHKLAFLQHHFFWLSHSTNNDPTSPLRIAVYFHFLFPLFYHCCFWSFSERFPRHQATRVFGGKYKMLFSNLISSHLNKVAYLNVVPFSLYFKLFPLAVRLKMFGCSPYAEQKDAKLSFQIVSHNFDCEAERLWTV